MPLQTFRYAACGGSNLVLNFTCFTLLYHFFAQNYKVVYLDGHPFESYSIALFIAGVVSFFVGFLLNKYIVFDDSNLKGRIQFFRYFLSFASNLALNYIFLKFLVAYLYLHPVVAQSIVTVVIVIISYITQRHFSFKAAPVKPADR
ncbi:MAG: GtrA family protein [Bacteroidota bacterium]